MRSLLVTLVLFLASCGGASPPPAAPPSAGRPPSGEPGPGAPTGGGVAEPRSCETDADCGATQRCDTCPSSPSCPECDVCGKPVCVER